MHILTYKYPAMAHAYSTAFQQNKTYPKQHKDARAVSLTPYAGVWTTKEVVHLLKRTMFGASKADVDHFLGMNVSTAVDELLTSAPTPTPPLNNYNDNNYTDPNVPAGQTWVNAPADNNNNAKRRFSLKAWWTGLMLNQGRSIEEKMVLFWHNHFVTEVSMVGDPRGAYKNNALLRQHALGNFKQFVKEVTLDVAMLRYLNGYLNTKNAPDENYARELQELFTVGKDPQLFSEDDVKAAAKVLTGYRIDTSTLTYYFDSSKHDVNNKQFSSFYSNTIITGQGGANGELELDDLLNMIFARPQVAEFICRKLYRYFVYYTIDSEVETNIIQPLATIFRDNNYDIKPVLAALLKSEHFFDTLSRGCVIKTPADFFVGACREYNAVFPDASNIPKQYYFWRVLHTQMAGVGMDIGDPPNVAGWPAWYQQPGYYEQWINSDTLPKRTQFADVLITTGFTYQGTKLQFDTVAFVASLSYPSDPNDVITDTLSIFYSIDTDIALFNYLKAILLSNQAQDHYWSDAWNAYINNPTDITAYNTIKTRLVQMFQYLMNLAEYQLA